MRRTEKHTRVFPRRSCREHGTQVVELAIALPLLCLLVFFVTEAAAFVRVHQVINNAAREAARVSSLEESRYATADQIKAAARDYAVSYVPAACAPAPGGAGPAVDVNVELIEIASGAGPNIKATRVTVTCNYHLAWVPPFFDINTNIPLKGTAVFRNFHDKVSW